MEILYIHYHAKNKVPRYLLMLYLGQRAGKICGIITSTVGDREKQKIIDNRARLSALSLEKQLEWIKYNCPAAYNKGYREINQSNMTVVEKYSV